jgi:hypothetical protein
MFFRQQISQHFAYMYDLLACQWTAAVEAGAIASPTTFRIEALWLPGLEMRREGKGKKETCIRDYPREIIAAGASQQGKRKISLDRRPI